MESEKYLGGNNLLINSNIEFIKVGKNKRQKGHKKIRKQIENNIKMQKNQKKN